MDIRVGPSGIHLGLKRQLVVREHFAFAFAPSIGGARVPITEDDGLHALEYRMPLIFGVRTGESTEWTFAPGMILASVGWEHPLRFEALIFGVSIGVNQRVAPSLRVHPELTIGYALPISTALDLGAESFDTSKLMFGAGMGFAFGRGSS